MKIILTTVAAFTLSAVFAINSGKTEQINLETIDAENQIACAWFPICRDPDFHQDAHSSDINDAVEALIACAWFPICRDPDQPWSYDVSTSALV